MIEVRFVYDEAVRKWDVFVHGAADATEAKQAFNAVARTILEAPPVSTLEHRAIQQSDSSIYLIEPIVYRFG